MEEDVEGAPRPISMLLRGQQNPFAQMPIILGAGGGGRVTDVK